MNQFKLIQGSNNNINKFENEVSEAMENGYECSSEMIVKIIENTNKPSEVLFFQPMTIEEHLDFEDDELDYTEEHDDESEI